MALDSEPRNEPIRLNVRDLQANLEFLALQLEYRNLHVKEQNRLAQRNSLSEQEMATRLNEILAEKQTLIAKIQNFIAANPNFQAVEQPDSTFLISNADLYYNLAELQYAVNSTNPSLALESYRKTVQLDPDFYNLDSALYNIGLSAAN
jgi:tetratricopeptide (TPR) repeat protein